MKVVSFFLGLSVLASSVAGIAFSNPEDALENAHTLEKRAFLPVVGPGGTAVRPRLEVRELKTNANQWTLYLLAMRQLQSRTQATKNSFYQIAGIHGVPRQNWDSVGQCSTCTADGLLPSRFDFVFGMAPSIRSSYGAGADQGCEIDRQLVSLRYERRLWSLLLAFFVFHSGTGLHTLQMADQSFRDL